MNNDINARISALLQKLNEDVFGKQHVIALSLLSAIAGESIFLLGPPGVAKSMVARRLKLAFKDASAFEYLMSRFSTPDEIFGPVSISALKDEDRYERVTDGYLPTATIVFLDEIWKAGPAIQNSLLTVINEKIFRNGKTSVKVPLKGLIAASNELPAAGQGLDALWDRFIVRIMVKGIEDLSDFDMMISSVGEHTPEVESELCISDSEYDEWQKEISGVGIHYSVFEVIHSIKESIEEYNSALENEGSVTPPLYVSDRRWKKLIKLMRTSAWLNGQKEIRLSDCLIIQHCIWNEAGQIDMTADMVQSAIRKSAQGYMLNIDSLEREIGILKDELSSEASLRESHDPGLQLTDSYYYQVEKVRLSGKLLLFASDYYQLDDTGKLFYLHKDKYKTDCFILKRYDISMKNKVPQNKIYNLRKGRRSVFINNYEYPLMCTPDALPLPPIEIKTEEDTGVKFRNLDEMIGRVEENCADLLERETLYADSHLFLSPQEKDFMRKMLMKQKSDVARYRNEFNEMKHAYRKENKEYPTEGTENGLS